MDHCAQMNYHIIPDDKFIDTFIEIAEAVSPESANIFLLRDNPPYKFVKHPVAISAPFGSEGFEQYIARATKDDHIYIHYLSSQMIEWINTTTCSAKLIWIFWGSEFFEAAGIRFDLYEPVTAKLVQLNEQKLSRYYPLHLYRKWKLNKEIKRHDDDTAARVGAAVKKLAYIMHYNRYDYDLIRKHFPTEAKFLHFFYSPPYTYGQMDIIAQQKTTLVVNNKAINVWLGNSGYDANNHLDYLQVISRLKDNMEVWAPLTYGDDKYIATIEAQGARLLGNKFYALKSYMTFDDFVRAIYAMDIGIMPHKRPQAFGNIQLLLYFGRRVYMFNNTLFRMLKEMGFVIFDIAEFSSSKFNEPLSEAEQQQNKSLIEQHFSKDFARVRFKECLTLID
jgi:dTDP-N-acetylfucosamine:lipid II N-acetylfucosaminyltransferase